MSIIQEVLTTKVNILSLNIENYKLYLLVNSDNFQSA
jgi:hypothetical protein